MKFDPSDEQQDILTAFRKGGDIVITAGAGTGKTSTLVLLAEAARGKKCLYMAFNKAIQVEADGRFPQNTNCRTAHSLAYREVMTKTPEYKARLAGGRVPFSVTKKVLDMGYEWGININGKKVTLAALQRCALDTVTNFCRTTEDVPQKRHVPNIEGIDSPEEKYGSGYRQLQSVVLPAARRAWEDIKDPNGVLRFSHDHYLKIWADTHPVLDYDVIFFDEAQDADPLLQQVVSEQTQAQRVIVGDSNQAIYQWRGAVDALSKFEGDQFPLSESWRFGPEIAEQANLFLAALDADLRIVGRGPAGYVGEIEGGPDAILCRSNNGVLETLFSSLEQGKDVHVVGGALDIVGICRAAIDLMTGKRTSYPDLAAFLNWQEVLEYVASDPDGSDLSVVVDAIQFYTAEGVIEALDRTVTEERADVIISTAHKAKGREWKRVQIHADFARKVNKKTGEIPPLSEDYLRLAYVAVTRAKRYLDLGPLGALDLVTL